MDATSIVVFVGALLVAGRLARPKSPRAMRIAHRANAVTIAGPAAATASRGLLP